MPDFELTIVRRVLQEGTITVLDVANETEARHEFEKNWDAYPFEAAMREVTVSWPDIMNVKEL